MQLTAELTTVVWNPVTGCNKISSGCDHCFALSLARRLKAFGQEKYQTDGEVWRSLFNGFKINLRVFGLSAVIVLIWGLPEIKRFGTPAVKSWLDSHQPNDCDTHESTDAHQHRHQLPAGDHQ